MTVAATRLLVYGGLAAAGAAITWKVLDGGPPKIVRGSRVFLLGDSLAVGLAYPLGQLAKDHGVAFSSMAIQGTRIDEWAASQKLLDAITAFKPTHILVSLGTNDEYMKLDAKARQAAPLAKLLSALKAHAPVLWIGPPKLPKTGTNGAIPLILENVPASHYFPSQKLEIPRAGDGLHPTVAGYAGWAANIWKWAT